ncbi:MAG: DUF3501 family protein [Alphaproteobacteria bacterium]|nr:DUF3501 family protein [Alphaproteobacteria bacterium]
MNSGTGAAKRRLTRDDILPLAEYAAIRRERRRQISDLKKRRRIEVGPFATFYFENYETMWQQVQEMLYIEKGGDEQVEDELAAYNPLIPQGRELVATIMFEIDDPLRRASVLARLGGIENHVFLEIGGARIPGESDPTRENTSADGKASAVQFVRFPFSDAQVAEFRRPGARLLAGFDHPNYGHLAVFSEAVRETLAGDFD